MWVLMEQNKWDSETSTDPEQPGVKSINRHPATHLLISSLNKQQEDKMQHITKENPVIFSVLGSAQY